MPEDEKPTTSAPNTAEYDNQTPSPDVEKEPATQSPFQNIGSIESQPVEESQPMAFAQPPKKSKKKLIIAGLAALSVVLIGGAASAYYMWYQSPQKVLSDALINVFSEKYQNGTTNVSASVKSKQVDLALTVDAKSTKENAEASVKVDVNVKEGVSQPLSFTVSADMFTEGNKAIYVKLKDVDSLVEKIVDAMVDAQLQQASLFSAEKPTAKEVAQLKQQMTKQLEPTVKKINNQWIKFDISGNSESNKQQECFTDAYEKLRSSQEMRDELLAVYAKNSFLDVKETLPSKDGNIGYLLDFNKDKAEAFAKAAEDTAFVKEVSACDESETADSSPFESTSDDSVSMKNTRLEVYVGEWSHALHSITFSGEAGDDGETADISLKLTRDYKDVGSLTTPKNAVDIKDLQKELGGATMNPFGDTSTQANQDALRDAAIESYRANNRGKEPTEAEIQEYLKQFDSYSGTTSRPNSAVQL